MFMLCEHARWCVCVWVVCELVWSQGGVWRKVVEHTRLLPSYKSVLLCFSLDYNSIDDEGARHLTECLGWNETLTALL